MAVTFGNKSDEDIINANIELHNLESKYYDIIHPEIFNRKEQERLTKDLRNSTRLIKSKTKRALDVGCGTGNITGKLLELDFEVTAIDISKKMISVLKKKYFKHYKSKKLKLLVGNVEKLKFKSNTFDFVATYSVLHHLPDYLKTIKEMIRVLKVGGVLYLDHERSNRYWQKKFKLIRVMDLISNFFLNMVFLKIKGIKMRSLRPILLGYKMADYHIKEDSHIDHSDIKKILKGEKMKKICLKNYYLNPSHLFNPFSLVYRIFLNNDMSLWVAIK